MTDFRAEYRELQDRLRAWSMALADTNFRDMTTAFLLGATAGEIEACKASDSPLSGLFRWAWWTGYDVSRRIKRMRTELVAAIVCNESLESENARLSQELAGMTQERDYARFAPLGDNHHNALACPYCSPKYSELRERIASCESENARLRAALVKYGDHFPACDTRDFGINEATGNKMVYPCTCGLDELLQPTKGETDG